MTGPTDLVLVKQAMCYCIRRLKGKAGTPEAIEYEAYRLLYLLKENADLRERAKEPSKEPPLPME